MLRDDLNADLEIFLATDEFAETIDVDGVSCKAVVFCSTREKSARQSETFEPLFGDFTTIYFKTEEFLTARGKIPEKGDRVSINGERFVVEQSNDELGMTKLICSAYRQPRPRLGDLR